MMELKRLSLEPNYQWHRNENDSQYARAKRSKLARRANQKTPTLKSTLMVRMLSL